MAQGIKRTEKRYFPRIKLYTPVRYQIRGKPDFCNGVGKDISGKGISLIIDRFIAPSGNLSLQINVLRRVLNPIGKVVWSHPLSHADRFHTGIEFVEFDPAEKKYLDDFIDMQKSRI